MVIGKKKKRHTCAIISFWTYLFPLKHQTEMNKRICLMFSFFLILWHLPLFSGNGVTLVCAGHTAKTAICRCCVKLHWRYHGFKGEMLKEGSEEDEEFYANQSLTKTRTLSCQESRQKRSFSPCISYFMVYVF